ncbi:hypothetical protein K378_01486 [Streptomyces sp. Amel2xB2]|nr:hypothetical protein K378_01486 [Streptomyces sp. Amel2xB2]
MDHTTGDSPPSDGHPGHCSWHSGWADDVVMVAAHEAGSGWGGGVYACLPCARPLAARSDASKWLCRQVEAMEQRATQAAP